MKTEGVGEKLMIAAAVCFYAHYPFLLNSSSPLLPRIREYCAFTSPADRGLNTFHAAASVIRPPSDLWSRYKAAADVIPASENAIALINA